MFEPIARGLAAGLLLSLLAPAATAQPAAVAPSSASAIDLPEALERTLVDNPALRARGFTIAAAEGRLLQSTYRPAAALNVTVEDAVGTGDYAGLSGSDTTVSLAWILERGRRERIVDLGRRETDAAASAIGIARLDVAAETARRYLDCLLHQAEYRTAETGVALARDVLAAVQRRSDAGIAPAAELARAEAGMARAELRLDHYEHELAAAYRRLGAQWGETEPGFDSVAGRIEDVPAVLPFASLRARIAGNPDLAALATRERVAEAEIRLAEAEARPPWELSGGLRRLEASDDWALVGGVRIPLPLGNRNEGRIAETEARRREIEATADAERIRIETDLYALWQELNHNVELAAGLSDRVVPSLEDAVLDLGRAFELGRSSYLELSVVQTELLDVRYETLDAIAAAHRAAIEIERLTGESLAPAAE